MSGWISRAVVPFGLLAHVWLTGCAATMVRIRTESDPIPRIEQEAAAAGVKVKRTGRGSLELRKPLPLWRQIILGNGPEYYYAAVYYDEPVLEARVAYVTRSVFLLFLPLYADTCNASWYTDVNEWLEHLIQWSGGQSLDQECNAGYRRRDER